MTEHSFSTQYKIEQFW